MLVTAIHLVPERGCRTASSEAIDSDGVRYTENTT